MNRVINTFSKSISNSLRNVHPNARAALLTQPLWSILGHLFMPYLTLYMLAVGCTTKQVGMINAVGMVIGTVVALFAGWMTDRLGRRLANALGDMLCWALAALIWGLSQNVIWFIAAAFAQSFMRMSGVAWNCVLSEGTEAKYRVNIFYWFSIVQTITIFVTPLMNLVIRPFGLVPAMRGVLIGSFVILTIAITIRYNMMIELPVGIERKQASKNESPLFALKSYIPILLILKSSPVLLISILLRTLYQVHVGLRQAFLPIAVVNGMGFKDEIIGTLNFVIGAIMLLTQIVLLPKIHLLSSDKALSISFNILIVSFLILVFAPADNLALLIISTVLYAAGSVITTVLVNTSLANALPDKERAQLLSFVTVVTVAVSAPAMWLGGLLSEVPNIGTRLPMLMISVLMVICLTLLLVTMKMNKNKQNTII